MFGFFGWARHAVGRRLIRAGMRLCRVDPSVTFFVTLPWYCGPASVAAAARRVLNADGSVTVGLPREAMGAFAQQTAAADEELELREVSPRG